LIYPTYLIDTNMFIRRSQNEIYDQDSFPYHWLNFDKLVLSGKICSYKSVLNELERIGDDVFEKAEKQKSMFLNPTNEFIKEWNFLKTKLPDWFNSHKEEELWADRDLIVYAKAHNLVIVSLESPNFDATKEKNFKIPTVCKHLGGYCKTFTECTDEIDKSNAPFQCIDFIELIKREKLFNMGINVFQ
jgi:hypothetical protein